MKAIFNELVEFTEEWIQEYIQRNIDYNLKCESDAMMYEEYANEPVQEETSNVWELTA